MELTVVTTDRPFLFATVAGALAASGMNIGKAGAFSNAAGTVVDTFSFTDRFRTLEMNEPTGMGAFQKHCSRCPLRQEGFEPDFTGSYPAGEGS